MCSAAEATSSGQKCRRGRTAGVAFQQHVDGEVAATHCSDESFGSVDVTFADSFVGSP